jgi:hypothetical protein
MPCPPPTTAAPPASVASSLSVMHPLTCFPAPPTASVGGVPEAQQDQVTPVTVSSQAPVPVTIQWPSEPAKVSLASVSVEVVPHQDPRTAIGQTPSPPPTPPTPPVAVTSIPLGTPAPGSTTQIRLDGIANTAGVVPPAGVYDVDVVQEVTLASSCESNTVDGPAITGQVTTTIGHVRLP